MRILTSLLFLLLASVSAFGQQMKPVNSVATIADLVARRAITGEELEVRNYSSTVLWDQPRTFRHDLAATNAHDGVHYLTNRNPNGLWVSADRTAIPQRFEWWGVPSDGDTDGTAGVQAAINYCYSNNVPTLEFPVGTILVSSVSFTGTGLVGGLALRGQPGLRSIIRGTAATTMFTFHTMRKVDIENLWFDANDIATNILTINNATEFKVSGNDFYRPNGTGLLLTGNQNYGHLITFNTFINCSEIGLDFNGVSATANTISRNKFEAPAWTNAIGIRLKGGVANQDYTANVFQSLRYGLFLEGAVGSGQINNSIDHNYFEVFTQVPIGLGGLQHSVLGVTRNYFYQDFTTGGWCVKDTNGCTLYGFRWKDNAITSDSGKALSLTNSLVRDWEIHAAPTDIATDYQLPSDVPIKFWTQSQPALSVIVTNFTVSGAATNLSIPGDLLPSRVEIAGSSNMTFSVGGFTYPGTTLTIRNAGTNTVTFTGINTVIRAGTEDTFTYRNSAWTRYVYPYLPDYGGTLYGSLSITNGLSVAGFSEFTGAVKLGNIISNFNGLLTGGAIGTTQAFVLKANADAILTIQKGPNNIAHFGTNNGIYFERPLSVLASTGILTHVYGFAADPSTGVREGIGMTLANLYNAMGITGGGGGGPTNGTALWVEGVQKTTLNLLDGPEIEGNTSGTNYTYSVVAGSLGTNKLTTAAYTSLVSRATHTGTQTASTISDFTAAAIAAAGLGWQPTNANLTTVSALTGGTSTNFLAGDGSFKQVTTNMIPGLVQALADGVAGGGGGSGAYTNTTGTGAYVLADSPTVSGNWVFDELTVGTFTVSTNLFSAEVAYGAGWNGSSNVPTRNAVYDEMELRAPKASPALTGDPTAPTATTGDADTSIATTAFVSNAVASATGATGVTAGTYTNSLNGNTVTIGSDGRVTAIDNENFQEDFDLLEEYVGPTGYALFVGTANGGAAATGTSATTLTNLLGMAYISTSGSNQYPQNLLSAPFINSGMDYAQVRARFRLPLLSTDADAFEWQIGIFDLGTTTNRPKAGAWITSNTNLGNANVFLCNGTNSTYSFADTGIPISAATWYSWAIRLTPSNSIAYYGNTPVATNSSSYPTATWLPAWGGRMSRYLHTASATRFMLFDRQQVTFRAGPGR